jgi:hypothetical protein
VGTSGLIFHIRSQPRQIIVTNIINTAPLPLCKTPTFWENRLDSAWLRIRFNVELCKNPFYLWSSKGVKLGTHFTYCGSEECLALYFLFPCDFMSQCLTNKHKHNFTFTYPFIFFIVHFLYNTTEGKHCNTHTWYVNGCHIPNGGWSIGTQPCRNNYYCCLRHVEEVYNFGWVSCCKDPWINCIRTAERKILLQYLGSARSLWIVPYT